MSGQLQGEPAVGGGKLKGRNANTVDAEEGEAGCVWGLGISELGGGLGRSEAGLTEHSGGRKQGAELAGREACGDRGEVGIAGPGEGLARVHGIGGGVGAVQGASGHGELAGAGDAACGVPLAGGDEAVEDERLERGAWGGKGARGLWQVACGKQMTRGHVEDQDARLGICAGDVRHSGAPGRRGLRRAGAQADKSDCDDRHGTGNVHKASILHRDDPHTKSRVKSEHLIWYHDSAEENGDAMRVLIFGATGMLGQAVLRECLMDGDVGQVVTIGRNATGAHHAKLKEIVHRDLSNYAGMEDCLQGFDACFFCLGVSSSGLKEADYTRLTYAFTLAAAEPLSAQNPGMTFIYVSGSGTDSTEKGRSMWARVKGRTENALIRLPLEAYMFRPGSSSPWMGWSSKTPSYRMFIL